MAGPRKGNAGSSIQAFDFVMEILLEELEELEEKIATKEYRSKLAVIVIEQNETTARMEDKIAVFESHLLIAADEVK